MYTGWEPVAQDFLQENSEAREYFEERAQSLGDERSLSEHLKLPIQRIHDYQLLLKDLVKYSRKLGEDVTDLNKALELMLAIPHKASDNKFISNIEGYHGNIHKLGRLLRHDWFKVTFADSPKEKERYLFLFKARILICKVKKVAEDRSVFVLKHIIRLPEVEIKDDSNSQLKFSLTNKFKEFTEYPIQLVAHKPNSKSEWLSEIRQYAADILALAEHAADDLRVQQETSSSDSKFGSLKGVELEISDDISTEDIEQFTGPPIIEEQKRIKSQLKHVEPPERPPISLGDIPKKKAIFRFSDEDELIADEIQVVAPDVEARIESGELIVQEVSSRSATSTRSTVTVEQTGSIGETRQVLQEISPNLVQPSEDKVSRSKSPNLVPPSEDKVSRSKSPSKEQQETVPTTEETQGQEEGEGDMSRYGSSGSRYRSVSSKVSEEVFVSSSGGIGGNNSSSSSRSFALVEESINGKTVRRDVMTSGSDSIGDAGSLLDRAGVKSYARTDSVGSGCAIEEISSVRHLDGKTYDNNNEEMVAGGRTARRGQVEDYGEQITSSSSTVRKSSKYSSSSTLDGGDTDLSSVRSKNTSSLVSSSILEDDAGSVSSRTKRPILDEEDSESSRRTKRVQDEDVMISSRTSQQYARQESSSTKRSLLDEEDDSSTLQNRTKKSAISALDEEETVSSSRRTKTEKSVGVSVEKESYSASVTSRASEEAGAGPEFIKPLESYSCKVGDDVTLECDVAADVLWLKNNRPIPLSFGDRYYPSSSEDNLHHKLQIMGVKESDEDSFTVRATNEEGHASYCTTRLTVEHDHQQDAVDGSPRFLIALRNTTVLDKTFLRFMVKVSGSPKPEVKFYKNDRFITPSNTRVKVEKARSSQGYYELILPQVREEDEGVYKCVAMNEHGEAESEATLSVTDDKTIFYGLEGSDLLKSGETPQFQWLRDGQPFQPEDRFKVDYKDEGDSLQLVFQNVKPEDAGLYTCVGTTSTGRLACSAELTIQGSVNQLAREPAAPKMSAESKTFESSLGSTAMMEFTCEGYPKPYLKIEKDGKDVEIGNKTKFMYESEEQVILAIKNLEPEDAGKYTVEAMNELGTAAQEFHLNIKALPKIKHAPPKFKNKLGDGEDVNIMVGQELKLAVGVEGIPKPDVKWLKDGKAVKETKDLAISYDDSGVHYLTIEKANLKDSGTYSVTATNEQSTITDFTRVTVHAPPVFLRTMTKTTDCNVGDTITYQIKVEGDPLPEVKWMKDGVPLQIDEQHLKVTADGQVHSLIVNKVKREDTGKYSALISNEHGSSQDDGRMNVRCAPLFTQKLEDFSALEGDQDVEFVVDIECYPRPVVKWFHDKTEITEKLSEFTRIEQTDGNTYKLVLKQVEREHAGKYICEVSNNLGKLKCEANFVVKAKPRFKKTLPETVEIDEGQSLTLSIDVEAVPEPEVKWYRNGQEISADANIKITRDTKRIENYNLTVTLVRPENGGEYEVRASNEVGNAVTKSRVLVHFPAQIIEERMDARKVFETLSTVFEVLAIGYPAPEATWFKDGVPLEESDRLLITNEGKSYKIEIVRTTHSDAGEYSVVIKNRLGEATSKGSLEIDDVQGLRSPRIKTPLESLIIHKYEKAQFTAAVITFPEPDIKWTIAGKDPQPVVEYIVDTKELDYGLLECTFTLFIPNGHHCHTGDVLFVASNEYGSCETGARLDVLLRPEIQALKDLTCEPYQTTQFEVEIDANPKPRVTWSFKGEKLCGTDPRVQITSDPDKDMYRVTIRNVGLGDEGVYEVEASNNLGVASALARLKVHRPDKTLAGDEDLEPSDLQTAKRVGDRDRNKPQAGDLDKTGGLTNGDIGEDEMLDSKRHKPGTLDCEDGRKPRRARFDIDDEDNDFDSEGNKPGSLDSKDGSKPRRGKFNVDEEGDTDSKHNEPGTLDSDTSGKPRRGKYGIDDSDEHGSKGKEPGSLDSKDGSKPRRDKFYVDDGGILNYMELARCYNFTNKVVFSTTWNSQDVVVTSQTWRYSQLHDSQDIVTSLPMMLLYLHKRFPELIPGIFISIFLRAQKFETFV
uniref:Muscle M-line assembly protein unc-89 n=1 Tax=Cacopsylla melanoneura TaxID=428564 RepID=A0A8D8X7L0_9HEMI